MNWIRRPPNRWMPAIMFTWSGKVQGHLFIKTVSTIATVSQAVFRVVVGFLSSSKLIR